MHNNPFNSCGFNPNRSLDEQLTENAHQHRPGFSQSLHEHIVQSIPWRHAEDLPTPANGDDRQLRQPTATAQLTYALVAAAACLLAVVFVAQQVPNDTTAVANSAPAAVPTAVPVAGSDRDRPADQEPSPDELAAVIEQTAAEMSSLARVATSEYWIDSAIEFQVAFDDRLQQLASVAEPD